MNRIEHYHDWLRDALVLNNILVKPKTRLFNWKLFLIVMTFHVQSLKIP